MPSRRIAVLALMGAGLVLAADAAPGWLKDQTSVVLPAHPAKVDSVIVFHEEHTAVGDTGRLTTTTRTAARILNRGGARPVFFDEYDAKGSKVKDFKAWMISPSGKVRKYGKDEILDMACVDNDVYNECRRRAVWGERGAEPGSVFGYESVIEYESFSNQLLFHFQDSSPVRLARLVVTAPPGWKIKYSGGNGAPSQPVQRGGSYIWQMEDLPALESETASPSFATLAPWVGVSLLDPGNRRAVLSWREAAKLLSELNGGLSEPNEAITAKAHSLVAGAATELEKIRAIAGFAQKLNYVSIRVNVSKGGGYQPHPAAQIYEKQYGDCKDKANLTRAMLKAVGIDSYPVAIYSGDRSHVQESWPSLGVFNHEISAIRVGTETQAPAVLEHPSLGRLLFFDPTDPFVPPGYLPEHEQASLALVGAGESGDLVRTPAGHPTAADHLNHVEAVLGADGSLTGHFEERFSGEALGDAIALYRQSSRAGFANEIERWVAVSVPGAAITGVEAAEEEGEFVIKGQFSSARFAQRPQSALMVFRAGLLSGGSLRLTGKTRHYPIEVDSDARSETVRIQLPAGFKVDELPNAARFESPFGKFDATWVTQGDSIVFKSSLEMPAQTAPVSAYADLKKFLDSVAGQMAAPVVLSK